MLKTLVTAAAATVFLAGAAYAAELEGTVKTFDPVTKLLTLESGEAFVVPDGAAAEAPQTGQKIRVVYNDGTTDATEVTVVE